MLSLRFSFDEHGYPVVEAEPPYTAMYQCFKSEVGPDVRSVEEQIAKLRGVIEGRSAPFDGYGNGWYEEVDAKTALLRHAYADPVLEMEMPTEWLLDALVRWRGYLVARKAERERARAPRR
jgi:hypothetical protein